MVFSYFLKLALCVLAVQSNGIGEKVLLSSHNNNY